MKQADSLRRRSRALRLGSQKLWQLFKRDSAAVYAVTTAALTFVSSDDLGLALSEKLLLMFAPAVLSMVLALVELMVRDVRTVWAQGDGTLETAYGDLFDVGEGGESMRVIPVNTTFDTVVDRGGCGDGLPPLVAPGTLHGKWIECALGAALTRDELDARIASSLSGIAPERILSVRDKPRGKREEYGIGTIAPVRIGSVTYLLVALSTFDNRNIAHSCRESLIQCVRRVLEYGNGHGQGADLFIPLMGTGRSRIQLDHGEALDVILACCRAHFDLIHGKVTVLIYEGDADKVSIWR